MGAELRRLGFEPERTFGPETKMFTALDIIVSCPIHPCPLCIEAGQAERQMDSLSFAQMLADCTTREEHVLNVRLFLKTEHIERAVEFVRRHLERRTGAEVDALQINLRAMAMEASSRTESSGPGTTVRHLDFGSAVALAELEDVKARAEQCRMRKFLRSKQIVEARRWPAYTDFEQDPTVRPVFVRQFDIFSSGGLEWRDPRDGMRCLPVVFVSHRWEDPGYPDLHGTQLEAVQSLVRDFNLDCFWFYDYSSLKQRSERTSAEDHAAFKLELSRLTSLAIHAKLVIVAESSYFDRAWCFFEMMMHEGGETDVLGLVALTGHDEHRRKFNEWVFQVGCADRAEMAGLGYVDDNQRFAVLSSESAFNFVLAADKQRFLEYTGHLVTTDNADLSFVLSALYNVFRVIDSVARVIASRGDAETPFPKYLPLDRSRADIFRSRTVLEDLYTRAEVSFPTHLSSRLEVSYRKQKDAEAFFARDAATRRALDRATAIDTETSSGGPA
eukprot:a182811_11.p1 GENE.a182811_11~~a182811_11.p1  ORF type:complete len:532 (-),score=52.77 a182811_11:147-1649(-)